MTMVIPMVMTLTITVLTTMTMVIPMVMTLTITVLTVIPTVMTPTARQRIGGGLLPVHCLAFWRWLVVRLLAQMRSMET